jgi:hypothetical protein
VAMYDRSLTSPQLRRFTLVKTDITPLQRLSTVDVGGME